MAWGQTSVQHHCRPRLASTYEEGRYRRSSEGIMIEPFDSESDIQGALRGFCLSRLPSLASIGCSNGTNAVMCLRLLTSYVSEQVQIPAQEVPVTDKNWWSAETTPWSMNELRLKLQGAWNNGTYQYKLAHDLVLLVLSYMSNLNDRCWNPTY